MRTRRSSRTSQEPPWERIHLIPDTPYAIDKRVWPQGPSEYRFTSVGLVPCDPVPVRLGIEIERLVTENAQLRAEFQAFVREWSERFGFLATENPRDSIESIDEVAGVLKSRSRWCLESRTPTSVHQKGE